MNADDEMNTREADGDAAPAVLGLPLNSGTAAGGVLEGGSAMSLASIAPSPITADTDNETGGDGLADRVEAMISDDGRFRSFASGLTFLVDDAGVVSLSGSVPSADLKRSLLASVHAVPGVEGVQDSLTLAE